MKLLSQYYQEKYGCKVYKLSLNGGFTCPNRDGLLGSRGCIFCTGSAEFAESGKDVSAQLRRAKERVAAKNRGGKYIAYWGSFTATYAPIETLRRLFYESIQPDDIVGLALGTRPDCLGEDVLALLCELNQIKPVSVELGLQTAKASTARYIRRGYELPVYLDAVRKLKSKGLEVVTHIILGLPGETLEDMLATTRVAIQAGTDGVKFHLLHVLENTDLAEEYAQGKFECMTLEQYAACLKACIAILPEHTVVHRITGDGAKKDLIAPAWSADKKRVLNYLRKYLGLP